MNLFDLFAQEYRAKRIDQKDPLLALDELIDFQQLVDLVEAIAPRKLLGFFVLFCRARVYALR